jgi:Fe-S oxidoreductase
MNPTSISFLGLPGLGVFWFVTAAAVALAIYSLSRRFDLLAAGAPEDRFDEIPARIRGVVDFALIQRRMFRDPFAGIYHILIFWGFVVLSVRTTQLVIEGLLPGWLFPLGPLAPYYETSKDLFELLVLVGVGMGLFRRFFARPARLDATTEGWAILLLIGSLMVTDLLADGATLALQGRIACGSLPVSSVVAGLLHEVSPTGLEAIYGTSWWIHLLVIYAFGNYLPYGKHFHIITAIPNVFFRRLGSPGALSKIDIEASESFGVSKIRQATWKSMLDMFTCTECGRCREVCPTTLTDKPLQPKKYVNDLRDYLYRHADTIRATGDGHGGPPPEPEEPLVGGAISEDTIWACTTCRFCEQACPVHITFVDKLIEMRRHLVLENSSFPEEAETAFRGMENAGDPWQMGQASRADWAQELPVRTMAQAAADGVDVLFWVGCAGSFEDRGKKVSRALVELLNLAGVRFAILGTEESCTGDSARRMGNEYLFQMMAQANVETLNGYGIKKIVTNCPHCFNTLANEYPQFGGNYEVMHGSELVARLVDEGRIRLTEELRRKIAYHDACYLGRYNDVYEAPRKLLGKIPGVALEELPNNREKGLCCGAGGGRMWMDEKLGSRINQLRMKEVVAAKVDSVAVACPFCMVMLGNAAGELDAPVESYDVIELVARAAKR